MDDFSVFGCSFDECLMNLDKVDKAKVEAIEKLPPLTLVRGICSFLGHTDWKLPFELMYDASDIAIGAEFDLEIRDQKGTENQIADHLSRLENRCHVTEGESIKETFPNEHLLAITSDETPWYVDYVDFIASGVTLPEFIADHRRRFLHDVRFYIWDEPFLYKQCADQLVSRCQRTGTITKRNEMPLQNILAVELFDVWGIDFIGPFPYSNGHRYILLGVDYVSKWVEAIALPTNDAKVVVKFVKKHIFTRFGTPRVLISDGGTHFCNKLLKNVLEKYGVRHKVATAYHSQTSGQV
ncbi:uncharacterized protein [Nicotiana sylvestris]|uniref:uncharacterized protein n=1 Tax=Nicotiana sylvestris TaxID=4096 RepID=UPI00388CA838